jgi:hypothetical protein
VMEPLHECDALAMACSDIDTQRTHSIVDTPMLHKVFLPPLYNQDSKEQGIGGENLFRRMVRIREMQLFSLEFILM